MKISRSVSVLGSPMVASDGGIPCAIAWSVAGVEGGSGRKQIGQKDVGREDFAVREIDEAGVGQNRIVLSNDAQGKLLVELIVQRMIAFASTPAPNSVCDLKSGAV